MAEVDYSKLTDRDLADLICERLMDWKGEHRGETIYGPHAKTGSKGSIVPSDFCNDDNLARLVRNRTAELGLQALFERALRQRTLTEQELPPMTTFVLVNATPRQQAEAALRALDGRQK